MTAPDVVYVVRPKDDNEELRHSLRSLRNIPHGKVWVAGYCPSWVTGVGVIPVTSTPGGHRAVKANITAACEHPDVSASFMYFNDDFFVMQPMDALPVMHRGPISALVGNTTLLNAYTRAARQTMEILRARGIEEPLMYDLHAPMTVTKAGMRTALGLCSSVMIQERSMYGNLNALGGDLSHNHKVRHKEQGWQGWPFLSTNDVSFRGMAVGKHIRAAFPDMSPYETEPPPKVVREQRRPVRYRSVGPRLRAVPV